MSILVTGGAGFIGSHLCERLEGEGLSVVCADDLSLGRTENIESLTDTPNFKFIKLDITDAEALNELFESHAFDTVFHLAANSDIRKSAVYPQIDYKNTFLTTYTLLECMRVHQVRRLVFSSTSAIYGDKPGINISESTGDLFPISYYGGAKLASEAFISSYSYMNDIQAYIFRFPNVIGERCTHGVIYDFINKLRSNPQRLEILGDGSQRKPYIYISDLADAIMHVYSLCSGRMNCYNISVEGQTSVQFIADAVCREMGLSNVKYEFTGGNTGWKGDVPSFRYDTSKIYELGWTPHLTSDEAVEAAVRRVLGK